MGGSGPELAAPSIRPAPQLEAGTGSPQAQVAAVARATVPAPAPSALARPAGTSAPRLEPIAPDRHVLRVTVSAPFVADLQTVREALSHTVQSGALEEVLHECIRVTLQGIGRQRHGAGRKTSAKAPAAGSRYVPVAVGDEVWRRDGGRSAFVGSDGRRCNSRHKLGANLVELERRQQAHDSVRNQSRRGCQTVVLGRLEAGGSVETAGHLLERACLEHATNSGP